MRYKDIKPGMLMRVRSEDDLLREYGKFPIFFFGEKHSSCFVSDMRRYCGMKLIVSKTKVRQNGLPITTNGYLWFDNPFSGDPTQTPFFGFDGSGYKFSPGMLESADVTEENYAKFSEFFESLLNG